MARFYPHAEVLHVAATLAAAMVGKRERINESDLHGCVNHAEALVAIVDAKAHTHDEAIDAAAREAEAANGAEGQTEQPEQQQQQQQA